MLHATEDSSVVGTSSIQGTRVQSLRLSPSHQLVVGIDFVKAAGPSQVPISNLILFFLSQSKG